MVTATLDRGATPAGLSAALRAAQFADVLAETAEWIASDLERRQASGAGPHSVAVGRIRRRAEFHRAEADRLRAC